MAVQVGSDSSLISSRRSTRSRKINVPAVEEVKSESEEDATLTFQPPMNGQANPPDAESNDQSTASGDTRIVSQDVEIKEEETEIQIEELSQVAVHVVAFPETPGNESPEREAIDKRRLGISMSSIKDEPTEGESSLNEHPSTFVNQSPTQSTVKCEWSLAGACVCADGQCEDCQASDGETDEKDDILTKTLVAAASPLNSPENDETEFHPPIWEDCEAAKETGNASDAESENVKPTLETIDGNLADGPVIEQVNTAEIKEEIPDIVEKGNANKESPMAVQVSSVFPPVQPDQELVGQAEDTALSFLSLRRSPRVPKRLVNYAVLPEAEEEDTGTSDSEESDSDHSEAEIQTETETDGDPSETEESSPIAASSDGHQSLSRQAFPCRYCGKRFARRQHVRRHEATLHHGIKISKSRPFLCPFPHCGSAFVSQSALNRHRNIHSNLRPFTCATCDAAFNHASSLRAHQRTHSAERPYVCALCLKAFKLKHALLRHARLHGGSKPSFTCADCRLSFTQKSSLERHRRETLIHSGLKPFKCTVCGGAFTCRSTLKKHSRTFHSI